MSIHLPSLPDKGILDDVVRAIIPKLPAAKTTRVVIIGCGVKIHFPWDKACARLAEAARILTDTSTTTGLPVEIVAAPEPCEDPTRLLAFLDGELTRGIGGIVFFHAAYTAGEIGSVLGRWLLDHRTPVLSWAWPEPGNGGANEANSLTCQNFILNMWKQLGVPYAWLHEELAPSAAPVLERFVRVAHARATLRNGKLLHAGGSRVTAFYDGEVDELAVMRRMGVRFDRFDLETIHQHGRKFTDKQLTSLRDALVNHPACAQVAVPDEQILKTYRFGLAMLDLAGEQDYLGATVKSWPDLFSCYGCAIDGSVSMMNDLGFCVAEEGEMNGLLSSLALHLLSGGRAVPTMMDLSLYRAREERLGIWHCGASPTRLLKPGSTFAATRHSILENGDPSTAVGLMLEFLLAHGPITVMRYLAPDAGRFFAFEGEFVDTPLAYRGSYGLMKATPRAGIGQIMGTILDAGLDHHWSVGYGHWHDELRMLNHFMGIDEIPLRTAAHTFGLSR